MENEVCQSCGMPMVAEQHFGTNIDGSPNHEYCSYCYKDGKFTAEETLDEMIASNLQYMETDESRILMNEEEKALKIRLQLVTLKRWKLNNKTQNEYFKAVDKVLNYIQQHIQENIELEHLAEVACISSFHFHRIFKAIINETPGEYIQRIRLEKAAFKLRTTSNSLAQIAEETGYQTPYALSKAFKKRFQITPSAYKTSPGDLSIPTNKIQYSHTYIPEIKQIDRTELICVRVPNPYKYKNAFTVAWNRLMKNTMLNGIPDNDIHYYSLSIDVPTITQPDRQRFYVCISTSNTINSTKASEQQTIEGGKYAVFTVHGPHKLLSEAYSYIYRYWIPNSNYQIRDCIRFEKYLNSPDNTEEKDIITEIYIPVQKYT